MTSDRRTFLRLAGAVSAVVAGGSAPAWAGSAPQTSALKRSAFARVLGDDFVFENQVLAETVAKLTKVEPLPAARTDAEAEDRFRVVFKVSSPEGLQQLTYRVRHEQMGEFVMFVSPRSPEGDVVEAVFNRI
jgi:hypothetical protein